MKQITIAILVLVGLISVAGSALAEKATPGPSKDRPMAAKMARMDPNAHMAMMTEKLGLSEEQAAEVKEIFKAHDEASKAHRDKVQAVNEKIKAAKKSGNEDALKAAKAEREQLSAEGKTLRESLDKELATVLNEEQMAKLKEMKMHTGPGKGQPGPAGMFAGLNLTEEQKQQIAKIREETRNKIMAVLTEEQRAQLEQHRQMWQKARGMHMDKDMSCPFCSMKCDDKPACPTTKPTADVPAEN